MAADKEKDFFEDDEIFDLTEVVEEGVPPKAGANTETAGKESDSDSDFDEDLSDLFESLSSDKDSSEAEDDGFADLFEDDTQDSDHQGLAKKQETSGDEEDFLKDFLDDAQEEELDEPKSKDEQSRADGRESHDADDMESFFEEPEEQEVQLQEKAEPADDDLDLTEEMQLEESSETEDDNAEQAEPEGHRQEHPFAESVKAQDPSSGLSGEQIQEIESLAQRIDELESRMNGYDDDFADKTLSVLESKGSELSFLRQELQSLREDLEKTLEQKIEAAQPEVQEVPDMDTIRAAALEAVEDKGLDLGFVSELSAKIIEEARNIVSLEIEQKIESLQEEESAPTLPDDFNEKVSEVVDHKVMEQEFIEQIAEKISQSIAADLLESSQKALNEKIDARFQDMEDHGSTHDEVNEKLQAVEDRIGSMVIPDPAVIREEILSEVQDLMKKKEPEDLPQPEPDQDVLRQEISIAVESRINALIASWQTEKKALAGELENALKFWGKMQEKLTVLSQDIGELRDKRAEIDPEVLEKIDSINELAVTRDDLKNLASQLRVELEEYIIKKVPEAAAKVIREEISAMVKGK